MKYYSEDLKQLFESEKELKEAEKEQQTKLVEKQKLAETKKARAKEIEDSYKNIRKVREESMENMRKADAEYNDLVNAFVKDFGSYHMTYSSENANDEITVSDVVDEMFKAFETFPFLF